MSTIDRAATFQVYEVISNVPQIAGLVVQGAHAWLSGEGNGIRYHPDEWCCTVRFWRVQERAEEHTDTVAHPLTITRSR